MSICRGSRKGTIPSSSRFLDEHFQTLDPSNSHLKREREREREREGGRERESSFFGLHGNTK